MSKHGRNPGTFKEPIWILKEKVGFSDWTKDSIDDIIPVFEELESEKKISQLSYKIGRKNYYIHSSKMHLLNEKATEDCREVRLISPMDTIVRDKTWLKTFVGYLDCKMDWRIKKFIIKERNIFNPYFNDYKGIDTAIEELTAFHEAKEIIERV